MKISNPVKLIIAIAVPEAAGIAGAFFTAPAIRSGWYASLIKPELAPPNWVFGPVWAALYFLMGISLYLVWKRDWKVVNPLWERSRPAWNPWSERLWRGDWQKANMVAIFALQLLLNIKWSFVFFALHSPALAFFVVVALWISILYVIINFYRVSKLACWLLVPYLLWVTFAAYLNFSIWMLN
jgi:benzodiazapine receptor